MKEMGKTEGCLSACISIDPTIVRSKETDGVLLTEAITVFNASQKELRG